MGLGILIRNILIMKIMMMSIIDDDDDANNEDENRPDRVEKIASSKMMT